jgi:hypothetical protein
MPKTMNTVASEWEEFRRMVIQRDLCPGEAREFKEAFYSGVLSVYAMWGEAQTFPEELRVAKFHAWKDEALRFARARSGRHTGERNA